MRLTRLTTRATRLARAEQAWSRDSLAPFAMGTDLGYGPSYLLPTQDRVENPGRRAPFE
jgi:hypothetical protein